MPRETAHEVFPEDVKFLLVILLLFVFYPVGLILMWAWTKWPTWVKVLISLPVVLGIVMVCFGILIFIFALRNGVNDNWHSWQVEPRFRYYRGYYMQPMMQPIPSATEGPTVTPTLTPTTVY